MKARSYRNRLATKPGFKESEAARKAEWLETEAGKASNLEGTKRYREKVAKKKATGKRASGSPGRSSPSARALVKMGSLFGSSPTFLAIDAATARLLLKSLPQDCRSLPSSSANTDASSAWLPLTLSSSDEP